jgi:amidase
MTMPGPDELREIGRACNMRLSDAEIAAYCELLDRLSGSYERLDQLWAGQNTAPPVREWRIPRAEENQLGAWHVRAELREANWGLLDGKRIAIKDTICVAGLPMTAGSSVLSGYICDTDATVVTRVLASGGTIAGKSVCEDLGCSGGSHTSVSGPVRNPHNLSMSAGGSSSGSAALVAAGEVDMALGGDQGGSIRIPSCWCGIYGLKPSYGLVPYTGILSGDAALDHVGPMAGTAADVALLLDVVAGPDGNDPRRGSADRLGHYRALTGSVTGLRIGVLDEGFGWPGLSEQAVDQSVRSAVAGFARLGATVVPVSVPMHRDGRHIWVGLGIEGTSLGLTAGGGMGIGLKGAYCPSLMEAVGRGLSQRADELAPTVKLELLLGRYVHDRYHGRYYAVAQNLARTLTRAYDDALARVDVLAMPTLPMRATALPPDDVDLVEYVRLAQENSPNTTPFDLTGHPALNVPCGLVDGLPVGLMLVGRPGEDSVLLRAADAFEREIFARPLPAAHPGTPAMEAMGS